MSDQVNHPKHYTSHPSGVECITVVEHMTFCAGNAMKYLWRAGLKGNDADDLKAKHTEDLKKARWYIDREIDRLSGDIRTKPPLEAKPQYGLPEVGDLVEWIGTEIRARVSNVDRVPFSTVHRVWAQWTTSDDVTYLNEELVRVVERAK